MDLDLDLFKIKHNNIAPSKGRILLSEPFSKDIYFKRSVVLLTEHNPHGSVGFILNKPIDFNINKLIKDFPEFAANVSIGGPVKTDSIHFMHVLGDLIPGSMHVMDDLYWGGDFDTLKELIVTGIIKPDQIRFFVGYSGWHPKQLDNEIGKDFWLVTKLTSHDIMAFSDDIWKQTLSKLGEKYKIWSNFPENPGMN